MIEIIQRLKRDVAEESGTSPSFLADLQAYMRGVEDLARNAKEFGDAFSNACCCVTGRELSNQASQFLNHQQPPRTS